MSSRRPHQQAHAGRSLRYCALVAGVVTTALGLVACGDDKKSGSASSTPAVVKPTPLAITTSDTGKKRFSMQAPASVKGGLVDISFKNAGKVPHEALLVRLDGAHPIKELLKFVADDAAGPQKIPDWLHYEGGVASTKPGEQNTATENLPAGHYVVIDDNTGDDNVAPSRRGAIAQIDVTAGLKGDLPATGATIKVVDKSKDKYAFETTGLKAGPNELLFDNTSKEAPHHVVAFPILPGKTIADVKKSFEQEGRPTGPPPVDVEHAVNTEVLDGKRELVTTLTLQKGHYALICFLSDRDELKPHFKEGLLKEVSIP